MDDSVGESMERDELNRNARIVTNCEAQIFILLLTLNCNKFSNNFD